MQENINTPQPYLRVYPDADLVFNAPVERYARHLLPCVSIDLSAVNPAWSGWIHLVSPVEPEEGCVGDNTQAFHSHYLRSNWIAFRLDEQDRYELLGDFRYFTLENSVEAVPESYPGQREALELHYQEQHASYAAAKVRFAQRGVLYSANRFAAEDRDFSQESPCNLLDQLGGGAAYANWVTTGDFPLDDTDDDDVRPLAPNGEPFTFIASVTGWEYCASGADSILLFYEPRSRTALLTFDWS